MAKKSPLSKTLTERKEELTLQDPSKLKELYPLYPTVRREEIEGKIYFNTLVRKKYEGKYYLVPMKYSGETEAKSIHGIHSNVHRYLMLGVLEHEDVLDNDQVNECVRLRKL
jgi:hypothetical protein